ncbi:MAG TPA: DciA family protein [Noviherbaspirillum sp.]|uniref:DciA family protein n=1 Tax=Noviherbaspirillum sp. TaxID=1926288 RepID=UPI002D606BF9|nr:DciA family protein [Noviherbaspirillum sp.]HYD95395.1 DciA family protein [Noviherbaspirillum sp.]
MHDKMATLLPAVTRLAALQDECSAVLPALFDACSVLRFDGDQLTIAAPNAALAAKLKQQLPKLQDNLLKRGWQVNAIRIKVQVGNIAASTTRQKELVMPEKALTAFEGLKDSLEKAPGNQALMEALENMLKRHGKIR